MNQTWNGLRDDGLLSHSRTSYCQVQRSLLPDPRVGARDEDGLPVQSCCWLTHSSGRIFAGKSHWTPVRAEYAETQADLWLSAIFGISTDHILSQIGHMVCSVLIIQRESWIRNGSEWHHWQPRAARPLSQSPCRNVEHIFNSSYAKPSDWASSRWRTLSSSMCITPAAPSFYHWFFSPPCWNWINQCRIKH